MEQECLHGIYKVMWRRRKYETNYQISFKTIYYPQSHEEIVDKIFIT